MIRCRRLEYTQLRFARRLHLLVLIIYHPIDGTPALGTIQYSALQWWYSTEGEVRNFSSKGHIGAMEENLN